MVPRLRAKVPDAEEAVRNRYYRRCANVELSLRASLMAGECEWVRHALGLHRQTVSENSRLSMRSCIGASIDYRVEG